MTRRWSWILVFLCAVLSLAALFCGWLVPAYLRAVPADVLQRAGKGTPSLVDEGTQLIKENKLGAAEMLLEAARHESIPERAELGLAVTNLATQHAAWEMWGGGDPQLERLFTSAPRQRASEPDAERKKQESASEPLTEWVVRLENRGKVLDFLRASEKPEVTEILKFRYLTNTVVFSPSESASGQALDAAVSVAGLLLEEGKLNSGLSREIVASAAQANGGGSPQPLEETLLDLLSLGQRFNWTQLSVFVGQVPNIQTLRLLGNIARKSEDQLAVLFSAVQLSGNPVGVGNYIVTFSRTGLKDLGASLRYGAGGVRELLKRQKSVFSSGVRQRAMQNSPLGAFASIAVDYAWRTPIMALCVKWCLYLVAGFLLAAALHFGRPPVSRLETPLQVRGFHIAREILFALGFLVVILFLSEPFLAQESQKAEFAFRLRLPMAGGAVTPGTNSVKTSFMDPKSLLTLLLFFVLQGLIYTACLVKLAEIRRQRVEPRIKLRLLENEEHLFDAGLYLGFAGTIISLILVSLGFIKPSLMAAYSSTSFGIIFVSIFKIFHLRPERRRLLLQAEAEPQPAPVASQAARTMAAPL
jgi:hypothetical protein